MKPGYRHTVTNGYGYKIEDFNKFGDARFLEFLYKHKKTLATLTDEPMAPFEELYGYLETLKPYYKNNFDLSEYIRRNDDTRLGRFLENLDANYPASFRDDAKANLLELFTEIIYAETGVRLEILHRGTGYYHTEPAVVFRYNTPWDMEKKERTLTRRQMQNILRNYANEIGVQPEYRYF